MPETAVTMLNLPARQVVLRLARLRLEEWARARARLDDPADPEALHDFRVALRRFRSLLRAFRPACDELVPRRLRRRMRRLADATSESRDLEVQRVWLQGRLARLTPRQRAEARWMATRLEQREVAANERLHHGLKKSYGQLHERLWATLTTAGRAETEDPEDTAPLSTRALVGRALAESSGDLEYRLGTIHAVTDEAESHAARLLVKRLRYLLEPFDSELHGASTTIALLKQLQDLLGDLHDLCRMARELRMAFRDAALCHADARYHDLLPWGESESEPAPPKMPVATGGLVALARIVRLEGEALLNRLRSEWLDGGGAEHLAVELRALGAIVEGEAIEIPATPVDAEFAPESAGAGLKASGAAMNLAALRSALRPRTHWG